ncbi:hypothetical protein D915_007990 [Fasciola hepatica]|uniref:Mini-chromosome maintenance complex-binding protein n=1 Tax=Fasciola hepatica TaxID=6192 RepID=A0A4E0R0F2_FASHE|nr:hypothetical protein D915_007990 [Fasciola hepatica]
MIGYSLADDKSSARKKFIDDIKSELESASFKVPTLNEVSIDSISDGHLVAVHGMVQDMFNSELYMDEFSLPGSHDRSLSLCFRDFGHEEVDLAGEPQNVKFSERQSFYVVPVPGESDWVQKISFLLNLYLST